MSDRDVAGGGAPAPEPADPLTPAALQAALRTAVFGHRVFYYAIIASTNDRALELAAAGEPEGSLVLAEQQTGGRGRRDRVWISPPGLGIYASIVLRPGVPAGRTPLFTIAAAVAVAVALRETTALPARIKWPNDVFAGGRKIAGILGESRGADPEIREVIIGIGINVHQRADDFPGDLARLATSVRLETERPPPRRASILAAVLEEFERRYHALLRSVTDDLLREWRDLSAVPAGSRVVVEGPAGRREGDLMGVDADGALLLREESGATARIPFGEIVSTLWPS